MAKQRDKETVSTEEDFKSQGQERPVHLDKFLLSKQLSFLESAFVKSKFAKTEMHTREEWDSLIQKELTRDLK